MRVLWVEAGKRDKWAGHTGSCRPWWKPEKGFERVVKALVQILRKFSGYWVQTGLGLGRESKQGDQLGKEYNHPEMHG